MNDMPHLTAEQIARFWSFVDAGALGCWPWTGQRHKGYGCFQLRFGKYRAHRIMYQLEVGNVESEDVIRHTCDVPLCVQPNHLLKGTQLENVRDRVERGRSARGEMFPQAQCTVAEVTFARQYIRAGASYSETAIELSLPVAYIYKIARRGWPECAEPPIERRNARTEKPLTAEIVCEARRLAKIYPPIPRKRIAQELGVDSNNLNTAIVGDSWKDVPEPPAPRRARAPNKRLAKEKTGKTF